MAKILEQHIGWIIFLGAILAFWILALATYIIIRIIHFKIRKIRDLMKLDGQHEEYSPDSKLKVKGRTRDIWDYNFFPGMSKKWHFEGWKFLVAIGLVLIFLLLYMFTRDDTLSRLLGLNVGLLLGMLIKK